MEEAVDHRSDLLHVSRDGGHREPPYDPDLPRQGYYHAY